ncbi:hypothetical protein OY671_003178 [Metschnikowia pulcherrima]|nr:hypothetical protein OY671_003178 [Metschnikowia pulcherrima]
MHPGVKAPTNYTKSVEDAQADQIELAALIEDLSNPLAEGASTDVLPPADGSVPQTSLASINPNSKGRLPPDGTIPNSTSGASHRVSDNTEAQSTPNSASPSSENETTTKRKRKATPASATSSRKQAPTAPAVSSHSRSPSASSGSFVPAPTSLLVPVSDQSSQTHPSSLQAASVSESRSPQVATLPNDVSGPLGDVSCADSCSILGGSLITGDTPCVRTEKVSSIRKHMHSIIPQSGGYALSATMQPSILQAMSPSQLSLLTPEKLEPNKMILFYEWYYHYLENFSSYGDRYHAYCALDMKNFRACFDGTESEIARAVSQIEAEFSFGAHSRLGDGFFLFGMRQLTLTRETLETTFVDTYLRGNILDRTPFIQRRVALSKKALQGTNETLTRLIQFYHAFKYTEDAIWLAVHELVITPPISDVALEFVCEKIQHFMQHSDPLSLRLLDFFRALSIRNIFPRNSLQTSQSNPYSKNSTDASFGEDLSAIDAYSDA